MKKYSNFEVRIRAVKAVVGGLSAAAAAKAYQTHRGTIYRWMKRSGAGAKMAGLKRLPVTGRPRKIDFELGKALVKLVRKPASKFRFETDFWTCGRLVQVLRTELKVKVSKMTVLRRLKEAELSYQKPERRYLEASDAVRREWMKTELPKILATVKKHRGILYFEDEANISLTAFLGRTWAPRGQTPKVTTSGARGGIAAMSAISKSGSLVFRLLEKRIGSAEVIGFLKQLLKHHSRRHLVVVMDRASPHTSKKTMAFVKSQPRLHLFYLPPYSPEWNPDEKVWNHLKHQELKSHGARTNKELKSLAHKKLTKMSKNSAQLRGIFFRCCVAELL